MGQHGNLFGNQRLFRFYEYLFDKLIVLEILEDCIVFFNERIYISALYRRHTCAVQVKCSTSTSVLYK